MKSLVDPATEMGLRFRVNQLQAATPPLWGSLSAPQALRHMVDVLTAPLAETPAVEPPRLLAFKSLWVRLSPCPDARELAARAVPEPDAAAWKVELQAWQDACGRFVARCRAPGGKPLASHPLLGPIAAEEWGRLVYQHTDHHLRQFRV